jgi:hypothetical protein
LNDQIKVSAGQDPTEQEWRSISKRLVLYAAKHHRLGNDDAQEVAQEAIRRYFDPKYAAWDREKYPELLRFLGSTVNGIVSNMRKRAANRHELATDNLAESDWHDHSPSAEQRLLDAALGRKAVGMLLEAAKGNQLVEDVCLQMFCGIDTPAEQASALGVPVESVYEARRRLDALKAKVKTALGGDL